jgi:hypothetical protein
LETIVETAADSSFCTSTSGGGLRALRYIPSAIGHSPLCYPLPAPRSLTIAARDTNAPPLDEAAHRAG